MNSFLTLLHFEMKKIFSKKMVIVVLILAFVFVAFSGGMMVIGGNAFSDTPYEQMLKDKQKEQELSQRAIDKELILEASKAYQMVDASNEKYTSTNAYQDYARKYSPIYGMVRSVFSMPNQPFTLQSFQEISPQQASQYYSNREQKMFLQAKQNPLFSEKEIQQLMALDKKVQKPFIMEYTEGYQRFFELSTSTMAILLFVLSFCIAPIFSEEYEQGTARLILTTKHGKNKLMYAKLAASLLVSWIVSLIYLFGVYFVCMGVYGFEGFDGQIQLMIPDSPYALTMGQAFLLLILTSMFGAMFHTSICFLISSMTSRAVIPLMITGALIAVGMFQGFQQILLAKLRYLLPVAMGIFWDMITPFSFSVFGIPLMLYQMIIIVSVLGTIFCAYLAFRNFKNFQP